MSEPLETAEDILLALMTTPHMDLGDLVYEVRDRELKGWEGPAVTQWGEAVTAAEKWMKQYLEKTP